MKSIFKYYLNSNVSCMMPEGAFIIDADYRDNSFVIWAIVDLGKSLEKRNFKVVATGEKFIQEEEDSWVYIKTIFVGWYIWHLMEVVDKG